MYVRFMGATAVLTGSQAQRTATSGYAESMDAKSNKVTLPAVDAGETLLAATIYMYVKNPDTNAAAHTLNNCCLYINNFDETYDDTNYDLDVGEDHTYTYDITDDYADYEGRLANIQSTWTYQTEPRGQSVWCVLTYQTALFTGPATTTCNGTSACYNGTLAPDVWSSWITLPATFITGNGGSNDITYDIGGNLYAGVQLKFNYVITATVEDYEVIDIGDSYTEYDVSESGYATTTCNATGWPTTTLEYGNGSIVLEFTENLGVTVPATTWTANHDIFWFTDDYEPNKIGTVVQSRGTKFAGGTMYSLMSDWATVCRVYLSSYVWDTYTKRSESAGATLIYTLTTVPTSGYYTYTTKILSPGKSNQETVVITHTGSDATGRYYWVQTPLTYAHEAYEEVLSESAQWTVIPDPDSGTLTAWVSSMSAIYGAPDGSGNVSPSWPVLFGNEIVNINNVTQFSETKIWLTADSGRGTNGLAYSHYNGCPVYCVPTVGQYAKSDSMYAAYGVGEVYLNPLGIVDNNTLDIYCYNALMNSTGNATNARGSIPACNLPATISIGDWVNIQMSENDYTWLSGWTFRRAFVVNNTGSELTNYQHKITVHRTYGADSGNDVYPFNYCQADYDDIRFTNEDGDLLDYWIESRTTTQAVIWVELDVVGNGDNTFYMYYLNPSAGTYSNGEDTFSFFDDFSGTTLDTDKWTQVGGGTPTFSSGYMTVTANSTDPSKIIATSATTGDNTVFTARFKVNGGTNEEGRAGLGIKTGANGLGYNFVVEDFTNVDGVKFLDDHWAWGADVDNWAKNTNYVFDIVHDGTNVKARIDGGTWRSVAWSGRTGYPALNIGSYDEVTQWDYAFTRVYAATEPTISSWTTESVTEITQDTFAYRLVGWEYDQMKGLFNLEFGAPDDYYMSNDVKYKGAVDVSLSLL